MRISLLVAVVTAAVAMVFGPTSATDAQAQANPGFSYVDADNDGAYDPAAGDVGVSMGVDIDALLSAGSFDTQVSQGDYVAPATPASLVILKKVLSRHGIRLAAGRDLLVAASITARKGDAVLSASDSMAVADGVKILANWYVRLEAGSDLLLGPGTSLRSRSKREGAVILHSETGQVLLGENFKLSCGWLCQISTGETGGPVTLVKGGAVRGGKESHVAIRSGEQLVVNGCRITGTRITLESQSSDNSQGTLGGSGPGVALVLNSKLVTPRRHGSVSIVANGKGSLIDVTGSLLRAAESVNLDADTVISN